MQSTAQSSNPSMLSRRQGGMEPTQPEPQEDFSELVSEISAAVGRYCSRRPQVVAGCVFSLGFIIGWKMRPW